MVSELQEGSLQGLLRARIAAARILAAEPDNAAVIGQLAFTSAWLAHEYGLRAEREAEEALVRLRALPERLPRDLDVTGALLALHRGERERALQLAVATSRQDREDVRPLLVLARTRSLAGDPLGAAKAAEAAVVRAPRAAAPLYAWAEARFDLGHVAAAAKTLRDLLARVPDHSRALLLLEQARPASAPALEAACRRDGAVSPVVAAGCDLASASTARARGDRKQALEHARAVGPRQATEPRVLARAALVLAQLGLEDEADALAVAAARRAAEPMTSLIWARIALALGRGELALPPAGLIAGCAETRLVAARSALAAGGPAALTETLTGLGQGALTADADLRALALLTPAGRSPPAAETDPAAAQDPVRAYAEGLQARLTGDARAAARWLSAALDGHGDACRAAGEYLVAARQAGQVITTELDPLRAVNIRCLNLALPPPPATAKKAKARAPD